MKKEISIILTSDIHLGLGEEEGGVPAGVRLSTFRKILALARNHDLLLIAGDLLDGRSSYPDLAEVLKTEFLALRDSDTDIFFSPGFNDLDSNGQLRAELTGLPFTHLFCQKMEKPYLYIKGSQTIYIYGLPATAGGTLMKMVRVEGEGVHLGLFHADFQPAKNDSSRDRCVINRERLKSLNLDFYALGYNHGFRLFKAHNRIIGAYPGSPEAVKQEERGDRFIISMKVMDDKVSRIKRLSVNEYRVLEQTIDCSDLQSQESLEKAILTESSDKTIAHFIITGESPFMIQEDDLDRLQEHFHRLSLEYRTYPSLEALCSRYEKENSLRGEFFHLISGKLRSNSFPKELDTRSFTLLLNGLIHDREEILEELS